MQMNYLINIATSCSRPQNLHSIFKSINFTCKWYIVFDYKKENLNINNLNFLFKDWIILDYLEEKPWGYPQKNFIINKIQDGFIYFLDDDNLIHPLFYKTTIKIINENKNVKAIFYSQKLDNNVTRKVHHESVRAFSIDQAQFLLHRSLIAEKRYGNEHHADGNFIESIYKENNKNIFYFYNENDITFYNKLIWKKYPYFL